MQSRLPVSPSYFKQRRTDLPSGLELIFGRKLQRAHAARVHLTEAGGCVGNVGRGPIGMIQSIESFETNIQLVLLVIGHCKVLVQRGIHICKARTMEAATRSVPEQPPDDGTVHYDT